MSSDTSSTMVSEPSGLLTCLQRFSALRTLLRIIGAWALGMGLVFIALQNAVASDRTILVFGDSLSAAYGIRPEQGWVALLAQRLQSQGYGYEVVNASVSGETTSGGLQRLPRALRAAPPGHRRARTRRQRRPARPAASTHDARQPRADGAPVAGGRRTACCWWASACRRTTDRATREQFAGMFPALAKQYHLPLVPFLLQNVALDPALMQEDGMHPNARGEPLVLENVWPLPETPPQEEAIERGMLDGQNLAASPTRRGCRPKSTRASCAR